MANTATQPTRSIADNFRSEVREKLQVNQTAQAQVMQSNRDNNLSAIRSIVAIQRATNNPSYRSQLTTDVLKNYANAIETYASKKGIKPSEDGKFSEEQKATEFTPEKMISFFSNELYKPVKNSEEKCNEERNEILKTIKEVYPDDTDENETIPEAIVIASKPVTKDMILSMINSGEMGAAAEAIENCQDPAEKLELSNLLEDQNNNQEDLERNAGRADTMRDPDWGHDKGDDDFKIQDGDIIQYLMKEVILSTAAWAGNRVAGTIGTFAYEVGSGINREWISPAWKSVCDGFLQYREGLFKDSSLTPEDIKKRKDLFVDTMSQSEDRLKGLSSLKNHISHYGLKGEYPKEEEGLERFYRKLENHYVVLEDDCILLPCNPGESLDSPERKESYKDFELKVTEEEAKKYAEIFGKKLEDFSPITVEGKTQYTIDGKTHLQYLQNQFDEQTLEYMKISLPNEKPEDIKKWLESYHTAMEERVKTNDDSKTTKMQKENPAYYTALHFGKEFAQYKIQSERFSIMYSQFMLLEEYRNNPESSILGDPEKLTEFMNKNKIEAEAIFHTLHKDRRDPEKRDSIPSISSMIDQMEGLVNKSSDALKNGSKEKIENPYIKQKPKNQKQALRINDAAKEVSIDEFLESSRNDLIRTEKELIDRYGENSERRDALIKRKENLFGNDGKLEEFKKEKEKHKIDLSKQTVSGGRKL